MKKIEKTEVTGQWFLKLWYGGVLSAPRCSQCTYHNKYFCSLISNHFVTLSAERLPDMRNQAAGRRKPCCAFLPCPDMTYCSLAEADSSTYAGRPGCLKSEHISLDFQGVLRVKALRKKNRHTKLCSPRFSCTEKACIWPKAAFLCVVFSVQFASSPG